MYTARTYQILGLIRNLQLKNLPTKREDLLALNQDLRNKHEDARRAYISPSAMTDSLLRMSLELRIVEKDRDQSWSLRVKGAQIASFVPEDPTSPEFLENYKKILVENAAQYLQDPGGHTTVATLVETTGMSADSVREGIRASTYLSWYDDGRIVFNGDGLPTEEEIPLPEEVDEPVIEMEPLQLKDELSRLDNMRTAVRNLASALKEEDRTPLDTNLLDAYTSKTPSPATGSGTVTATPYEGPVWIGDFPPFETGPITPLVPSDPHRYEPWTGPDWTVPYPHIPQPYSKPRTTIPDPKPWQKNAPENLAPVLPPLSDGLLARISDLARILGISEETLIEKVLTDLESKIRQAVL